ncbi:zinc finger protein with KRAB and SCAN domains 1 [Syngnathus scovelli]|uniref:zinc finger protein with KRAB and SCAN domains 1 n=1 Tax=Syngnathus scovelli TaxID=161590 RepID=UPI0021103077|nr:zinc finger protein with KRAB and SCAN domains 1 [Syngnathus scovelli]
MSDFDNLVVTFQTQLLDVMETVVKTAMYKVTQLVEDCFLDEVKRRYQELETLRIKLGCSEMQLNNHNGKEVKKDGTCVDITNDDNGNTSEERLGQLYDDVLMSGGGGKESDSRWTGSQICETEADGPLASFIAVEDIHKTEHADVMPAVNVKEEVNEEGYDSHSLSVRIETNPDDDQETDTGDVFLKNDTEKDLQISNVCNFPEGLESSDMPTDLSGEMHTDWTQHHHRVRPDWECDPAKSNCSLQQAKNEPLDSAIEDSSCVNTSRDQLSISDSSSMQNPNSPNIPITKQVVFVAPNGGVDTRIMSNKSSTKSGIASFSSAVKQNTNSHKTVMPDRMKLHSKNTEQDRLKHVSRPLKKPLPILSNSTAAPPDKISPSSKATPPTALSFQRDHLANKLTTTLLVNNRAQPPSSNSHHAYLLSPPECHLVFRHSLRCGQCGKCFPHPSNLKAHLQSHSGERPFCCSLCGRSFTKLSNLKAHRRIHTGERPYCCLACGKRFTQKCNLKRHQRIHVDEG